MSHHRAPFGNYMGSVERILADAREASGSQLIF